jgi:hypothetical protein
VLCKIFLISQDKYLLNEPVGIGLIFNGRIKGHTNTRFVHAMNALWAEGLGFVLDLHIFDINLQLNLDTQLSFAHHLKNMSFQKTGDLLVFNCRFTVHFISKLVPA